jgi:hypothetical protein
MNENFGERKFSCINIEVEKSGVAGYMEEGTELMVYSPGKSSSCTAKNKVGVMLANISHLACPSDISNWIARENLLIVFATHYALLCSGT